MKSSRRLVRHLGDQRDQLALEVVEDGVHLGGLHSRLVVVEQWVVRVVVGREALDVAALQLDVALERGQERGEVGILARLRPHVMAVGGGPRHLGGELRRHLACLVPVAAGDADQARLVGVVVEALLERPQLLEQRADRVRDELLVRDPVERLELRTADGPAARRHEHRLVPEQQLLRAPPFVDLGQARLQLGELVLHGPAKTLASRRGCACVFTRRDGLERAPLPHVGDHAQRLRRRLVDLDALRLAAAAGARAAQAGRGGDDDRVGALVAGGEELAPFSGCRLVDVAADDQLGAGGRELSGELPVGDGRLRRAPRGAERVVVEDGDPHGAGRGLLATARPRARQIASRPPD